MMKLSTKKIKRSAVAAALTIVGLTLLDPPYSMIKRQALSIEDEGVMGDVADFVDDADTPVYWHIPKASGSSMKGYYGCMGLVEATQMGITGGHDQDETLEVWEHYYGAKYVNVDTTRQDGILRAKHLNLAQSGLADVVFTEYPAIATQMFNEQYQARFFTLLRHPIERTVSLFYYRQIAKWEKKEGVYRPELADVELEEYARKRIESKDNGGFMVSLLLNKSRTEPLTDEDLQKAKDVLRTKFVVGLTARMKESVDRFDHYFGWYDPNNVEKREECLNLYVRRKADDTSNKSNANTYSKLEKGSEAWNLLAEFHYFDMQLYRFALQLFEEQGDLLGVHADAAAAWEGSSEEKQVNDAPNSVSPESEVIVSVEENNPAEPSVPIDEGNVQPQNNESEENPVIAENNVAGDIAIPAESA